MKIYVASRFGRKDEVAALQEKLRERGHEIIVDWTTHDSVKPYHLNAELVAKYAEEDTGGAMNCDAFILLSDEAGTGMHTELGVALASHLLRGTPTVYVIGEHRMRSPFFFHPAVQRRETTEEVLREL